MFQYFFRYGVSFIIAILFATFAGSGCSTSRNVHNAASIVDFLYPNAYEPVVTSDIPALSPPIRVGIAFVPEGDSYSIYNIFALAENKKLFLMQQIADLFKKYPFVKNVEIIPSAYLKKKGGFANLDKIHTMYGIDIIALISYDQAQLTDQKLPSLSYWTIAGEQVIPGELNDSLTMFDTVVLDIKSRKMLLHAHGLHHIKRGETSMNQSEQLRLDSDNGFAEASKKMIANLNLQLILLKDKISATK